MSDGIYITDFENEDGSTLPVYYPRPEVPEEFLVRHNAIVDILMGLSNEELVYHAANLLGAVATHENSDDALSEIGRVVTTVLNDVAKGVPVSLAEMPAAGCC